jgi:hypothetical protein
LASPPPEEIMPSALPQSCAGLPAGAGRSARSSPKPPPKARLSGYGRGGGRLRIRRAHNASGPEPEVGMALPWRQFESPRLRPRAERPSGGPTSQAQRNPLLLLRLPGWFLLRLDARVFLALLFQEPPRSTPLAPFPSCESILPKQPLAQRPGVI